MTNEETNPLSIEENIAIREKSFLELMEYPLINYCPKDKHSADSIIDNLLSASYSKTITKKEVIEKIAPLIKQSPIVNDVLSVTSIFSTINNNKPFSIAFIGDDIATYDPTHSRNSAGYYNVITKKMVVANNNDTLQLECMIHELAHATMYALFNNDAKPHNNYYLKNKYHLAIKNTLISIKSFLKKDFGLEVEFTDQNNTWQIGQDLSTMLFPKYLKGNATQNFALLLRKNQLNIDDQFPWLGGFPPLGLALLYAKFELANLLIAEGATIKPDILICAAMLNNSELMNWFLVNKSTIDINHKDCEGMTALDYASDVQIVKTFILGGAIAYPPNFLPICSIDPKCQDTEEDSIIITEQLDALEKLLMFYIQDYKSYNEDEEFIVRLPQIIASGLYKGKIVEILEPLVEYWQENISPATVAYHEQNDNSENCLSPLGYSHFL